MRVDLAAEVRIRDGEVAGMVRRAIIAPRGDEVSDFVISTGGILGHDVLVPRERLEMASREGDIIHLDLSRDELKSMPRYVVADYVSPDADWMPPPGYGYPASAFLWPAGYVYAEWAPTTPSRAEHEAELWPAIRKGSVVRDPHGEEIGVVDDIQVEAHSRRIEGMIIRAGGSIQTFFGGGKTMQVPASQIDRVEEGEIYLRSDEDHIERADH
jgi:sporulation protein YlmC with PRC-barrel domain